MGRMAKLLHLPCLAGSLTLTGPRDSQPWHRPLSHLKVALEVQHCQQDPLLNLLFHLFLA